MYDPDARPKPPKAPTIIDVAKAANVSKQTISRVVNSRGDVHESTRKRVLEVIQELGYQPNVLARGLVTNQSPAIGLVLPDISNSFYPEIARGVEDGAQAAGYSVFLCNADGSEQREMRALDRLRGHRIAGLIICNSLLDNETLIKSIKGISPVVLINREFDGVSGTVIWTGYSSGSILATNHLISLGRKNIAYLGMESVNRFQVEKVNGYRSALEQSNIPFRSERVVHTPPTLQGGYQGMSLLINRQMDIDAVFAFNDYMAIGALRYAAMHGLRVPEDIAIIGFGGSEIAAMTTPSLSTIAVPLYDIGATAVSELFNLMSKGKQEEQHVHAKPELVIRASTSGIEPEFGGVSDKGFK